MSKRLAKMRRRNARRLPGWALHVAATKDDPERRRALRDRHSHGAASEVRHIDPAEYEAKPDGAA